MTTGAWLARGGALIAILICASRLLSGGFADLAATDDPEHALAWRGAQPQALLRAAAARREANDDDGAAAAARAALAANPLDGRAYFELGLLAQRQGDMARAHTLVQLAAQHAPRDLAVRDWLMRYALIAHDSAGALREIDVMLRVDPTSGERWFPALALLANDAEARTSLAQTLAAAPPWRAAFWGTLCGVREANTGAIAALVDALDAGPAPLAANERAAWLERLIVDGHWFEAYPLWLETLPPAERMHISNIYDGSFEQPPQNAGFGWRVGYVPGARIERLGEAGDSRLEIAFDDRRVPFDHVRQLLALAPGKYVLRGRVQTRDLRNERGMQWVLACAGGIEARRIGETERFRGNIAWRDFEAPVVVPAAGCGAQWLRLQLAARIPAETQVDGAIAFSALRIERSSE